MRKVLSLLIVLLFLIGCVANKQAKNNHSSENSPLTTGTTETDPPNKSAKAGPNPEVEHRDKITIITPQTRARLCPSPSCGQNQHLARIPKGTELFVQWSIDIGSGPSSVTWYEVTYKGKKGYVSIYDTDKSLEENKDPLATEREIKRLEEKVRPIPASKAQENLTIYKKLAALDSANKKYKKKVAYYQSKVDAMQKKSGSGARMATTNSRCPGAPTLSSFQKATTASMNHQDWVVAKMRAKGQVVVIEPGTTGEIAERQRVMGGRIGTVRFVFPGNPNGFYGVWMMENCFD